MLKCKLSLNKKKLIKNAVTPHLWAHMIGVHTIIKNIFSSFNKPSRLLLCHTLQQFGRLWNNPGYTRGETMVQTGDQWQPALDDGGPQGAVRPMAAWTVHGPSEFNSCLGTTQGCGLHVAIPSSLSSWRSSCCCCFGNFIFF